MKSTLKRELIGRETVKREAIEVSSACTVYQELRGDLSERKPRKVHSFGSVSLVQACQHRFWLPEKGRLSGDLVLAWRS